MTAQKTIGPARAGPSKAFNAPTALIEAAALDPGTVAAATAFVGRLRNRPDARACFLFGSRARQTHRPDSDADIAVVFAGEPGRRAGVARELAGIAFDVATETGVLVDAVPLWEPELAQPERFGNPALLWAIRRDGRPL